MANELIISIWLLVPIFFLISLTYSSIGLGGGSLYVALMTIIGMNILTIPIISLILNLFVTSLGSLNFIINKHLKLPLILPFIITSIPMSYIGGSTQLEKTTFQFILFTSLCLVVIKIFFFERLSFNFKLKNYQKIIFSLFFGALLGFVAGVTGIGGGIYLIPFIVIFNFGTIKQAAACATVFVFINSLVGLSARLVYQSVDISNYLPLIIAVLIGAYLGSKIGSTSLNSKIMEKILGSIVLLAIIFIGHNLINT